MSALQFAGIWDESASFSAPVGHGNDSGMYGLYPCVLYPTRVYSGPNNHENLGCAEIPTTAGHLVQSQNRACFLIKRYDNATGSFVLTLTDRGRLDLF